MNNKVDKNNLRTVAKPIPTPNTLTAPYWQAAQRSELHLQHCQECHHWIHPPQRCCPHCHTANLLFETVSGLGKVESFSVIYRSFAEGFSEDLPYAIAWIELVEQKGLRLFSNISGCPIEDIYIGMPVNVFFEERSGFGKIPNFKKFSL